MRLMMSMPVLTLSHPRDTVMPRVTLRDYLAARHTDTRATSPKLCGVSLKSLFKTNTKHQPYNNLTVMV